MTAFLDTNILIKLLSEDEEHHQWCREELEKCKMSGPAIISDIVYCEFSVGMDSKVSTDRVVNDLALNRYRCTDESLYRAGVAFKKYKEDNNGPKLGVLPDFIIGAIAEDAGAPLITTNPRDFVSYFPNLNLISPT